MAIDRRTFMGTAAAGALALSPAVRGAAAQDPLRIGVIGVGGYGMADARAALKAGGRLMVLDFVREEGVSSDWILNHVRAGRGVFQAEIEQAGFELVEEVDFLKDNYGLIFRKR